MSTSSLTRIRSVWLNFHGSLLLIGAGVLSFVPQAYRVVSTAVALEGLVAFAAIARYGRGDAFRGADWVTSLRLIGGMVALLIPMSGYAVLAVLALAEVSDSLDGVLARRVGPTSFGAFWDAEVDAFFMLALSISAITTVGLPPWVIIAGVLRYAFYFLFQLLPVTDPTYPTAFRWFAKTACAVSAVLLVAIHLPILSVGVATVMALVALGLLVVSFLWETILRSDPLGELYGLLHSLVVYYLPFRKRRIRRMYRRFVGPGGLAFDIGSHVGNRLRALDSLGARIVAVEPNPTCLSLLRRFYRNRDRVTIVDAAAGAVAGKTTLFVSTLHPTLASASRPWIEQVEANPLFRGIEWNKTVSVDVVTLDELIDEFGEPDFVKIDVEGMESEVLAGLSRPVAALSFEFLPAAIKSAVESVRRAEALGSYEYNYSMVETMRLVLPEWISGDEVVRLLQAMPADGPSGDVYARSVSQSR